MMYTITKLERKTTSTGKQMIKADLMDTEKNITEGVAIWDSFPFFSDLSENYAVEGDITVKKNGNYVNKTLNKPVSAPKWATQGGAKTSIKAAQERKEVMIEKAQQRKNDSIAYFNAVNSAIALVTADPTDMSKEVSVAKLQEFIRFWRDYFLSEWEKYDASDKGIPF